jgi:hypothetical protein
VIANPSNLGNFMIADNDRRGELTEAETQALNKLGVTGLRRTHARGTRRHDDAEQWLALARLVRPLDAARATLQHKGPLTLDHVLRARRSTRMIVILSRQLATKRPEQLRTALNVAGVLEQTPTPFRGPETGAPDLLQTRPTDRPL